MPMPVATAADVVAEEDKWTFMATIITIMPVPWPWPAAIIILMDLSVVRQPRMAEDNLRPEEVALMIAPVPKLFLPLAHVHPMILQAPEEAEEVITMTTVRVIRTSTRTIRGSL